MDNSESRIPKEMAPEVFALASRLYAQRAQSYSLSELIEAGGEAKIPPEFIRQAVQQIQAEQAQAHKRQQKLRVGLVGAGVAAASLVFLLASGGLMASGCHSMMSRPDGQNSQSQ